jgi:polar amino acid transport system substrate-binding protein
VALAFLVHATPALAGDGGPPIRAVAGVFPPFVVEEQGRLTGFSIDLWNAVAAKLEVPTTYQVVPDTASAFEALRTGKGDVVVTGHFYTPERDREFDFSYSILNAGQQVMVRSGGQGGSMDAPLRTYLKLVFSRAMLLWLGTALLLLVVPAQVIWLLDRRTGDVVGTDGRYLSGMFQAMAWAAEALLGQASTMPGKKVARAAAILWLFAGVVFVALLVAQLTAATTIEQFRGLINGPDDLAGKVVGTQAGSTSVEHLRRIGARIETFASPDDAISSLLAGKVDAVVLAAPALQYYEAHRGAGRVRIVGPEFRKRDLGFMVPRDSSLHRKVDTALVALHDDGTYERLREKWFGKE